jgi:CBS domain-containing protein
MKIGSIMRRDPVTVHDGESLGGAQRTMARLEIRHLPVVTDGRVVGILSERDILAHRARVGSDDVWWMAPVRNAMTAPAQTANPEDSVAEVTARLATGKLGAMPIVERGRLVGLVTTTDVLAAEVQRSAIPPARTFASAEDVMTSAVAAISPEARLVSAAEIMVARRVRHVPVVDAKGTIIGMVSDRDLRDLVGDPAIFVRSQGHDQATLRVRDAMTPSPVTVREDTALDELALLFADRAIGAVPVVTAAGTLVGIVSYIDVLRAFAA